MGKAKRRSFQEQYLQVPNKTAQAVELKNEGDHLSLAALGLIVNLCSHAESYEIHKTHFYKRFARNKERSVNSAWKELVESGYMIQYKYRNGKKYEYVYIFDIVPYTPEQRAIIWQEGIEEYGEIWELDFEVPKMKTSNCRPQNVGVNKYKGDKNKINKNKENKNKLKDQEEEEERARAEENFEINNFAFQEFVKEFEAHMPNYYDNEAYNRIYQEMIKQKVSFITVAEAIEQERKMNNRKETLPPIGDWFNYLVRGIQMNRTSKTNAVAAEKFRKGLAEQKTRDQQEKANDSREPLPFYNWLDQD